MMTIDEARALLGPLEQKITELLQEFQAQTGLIVHSVPVSENNAANPATARVKVQL